MKQNGRLVQFPRPIRDQTLLLDVLEVEDLTVPTPRTSGYRPAGPTRRLSLAARAFQQLPFMGSGNVDPYADDGQRNHPFLMSMFAAKGPVTNIAVIHVSGVTENNEMLKKNSKLVKVELFAHERSAKDSLYLFFFKNKSTNIVSNGILFSLKILTCVLYVVRGIIDDAAKADCYGCTDEPCRYLERYVWPTNCSEMEGNSQLLCWPALLWVQNPGVIWAIQVAIAIWTLLQTTFLSVLKYKGHVWKVIDFYFLLEIITTVPLISTIFWKPLRNLFIPIFLNCWIAKKTMENGFVYHKLSGSVSPLLSQHLLFVTSTLVCLAFTAICGFEHIQRVGCRRYNFFESSYFVAVTLTTVGYGDLFPDIWLSKLYMVLMILIALAVMPKKFESLAFSWMEKQKIGGSYSKPKRRLDRHVVVCISQLSADTLTDFLNEFYSYRQLMDVSVVILSPSELDIETRQVLLSPMWNQKVVYIKGSCLKDSDLKRVRMKEADACFVIGVDNTIGKSMADEHTILRCWAVKDFAPTVPQYVQIFRPENKVHVKFAEYVVCEDEIKYAMLAYNCMCPGASTMITLLLHTSRGEEGQSCKDEWLKMYGKGSGNEVYHVLLRDSLIFNDYEGKNFTYTSLHTHRRYNVVLIGVKCTHDSRESYIKLNPGPSHTMRSTDICFYLSISREENMNFSQVEDKQETPTKSFASKLHSAGSILFRRPLAVNPVTRKTHGFANSTRPLGQNQEVNQIPTIEEDSDEYPEWIREAEDCDLTKNYPRVSPFIGASPTLCHIRQTKKRHCCMELTAVCAHCNFVNAQQYDWPNREIILVAEQATNGVYNFIVPLRAHYLSKASLQPIVLLLETEPDKSFLDAICWFPLIYHTRGSIQNLDDLLRAGVMNSGTVVIANRECDDVSAGEEDLADSNTIVAVQSVLEFFPRMAVTTELSQSSNMRFLHFQASNAYSMYLAEIEKSEKENGSNISFMFRLQFASGRVFSANMMDTLLYQAYVKDYIINIIRLMLGIDQAPGSAYLTSFKVTSKELKLNTYGNLFAELCASGGDVPICIYRTQVADVENVSTADSSETDVFSLDSWESFTKDVHTTEINNLIASRMDCLGINAAGYEYVEPDQKTSISYVIINPSCDLPLEIGDIIFVLRPNQLKTYPAYSRMSSQEPQTNRHAHQENAHVSHSSIHNYATQDGKLSDDSALHQTFPQKSQYGRS